MGYVQSIWTMACIVVSVLFSLEESNGLRLRWLHTVEKIEEAPGFFCIHVDSGLPLGSLTLIILLSDINIVLSIILILSF